MTYQGQRGRPEASEVKRAFAVSKIRWNAAGAVDEVLWTELNTGSNLAVYAPVVVPVADVVDAIHDGAAVSAVFPEWPAHLPHRLFEALEHASGTETIALVQPPTAAAHDLAGLDDLPVLEGSSRQSHPGRHR